VLGITSDTMPLTTVDAYAENILLQKISQISGVGLVGIGGQQKPAIRVQVDPQALASRGSNLEDVRTVLGQANVDLPRGTLNSPSQTYTLNTNDQLLDAAAYDDLIIAYRSGAPVRVRDVGHAVSAAENNLIAGWYNNYRAIILSIQRQPGANVVETVARIKKALPVLEASIPAAVKVNIISDRTQTIRASIADVQFTLILTVVLVVMVIFLFLRNFLGDSHSGRDRAVSADRHIRGALRTRLQPGQFVADGAVRGRRLRSRRCRRRHREHRTAHGRRCDAVCGFTIVSITLSLIAVFIPLFLMSGYVGLLFREFAVAVSAALVLSLLISLTLTPCGSSSR
jgi:multidrug efflux pump subunit AcrB